MIKRLMTLLLAMSLMLTVMTACKPNTPSESGIESSNSASEAISSDSGNSSSDELPIDSSVDESTDESTDISDDQSQDTTSTPQTSNPADTVKVPYTMPFDKPVTFTVFLAEHPSQPIKTDAMKWNAITEMTNVTLDVDFVAQSAAANRLVAATATGIMYDITWMQYMWLRNMKTTGFMDVTEVMKTETPTYYSLVGDDPNLKLYRVFGKYMGFHMVVSDELGKPYEKKGLSTAIRKDILDDANLKVPTTWQEWFDVMKKLKQRHPESTPFSGRDINKVTNNMAQAMTGYDYSISYNPTLKQYVCGATQSSFRPLLQFMKNCYDEGIFDPNFDKTSPATFNEAATSNKLFFWIDNGVNLVSQNNALQAIDKDAKFVEMNLMKSHLNGDKKSGFAFSQASNYATMLCISDTAKNKKELLHFIDWCYSEEGLLINNAGKQGVTYDLNSDGTPYFQKSVWEKFASNAMPEYALMSYYGFGQLCFSPHVLSGAGIEWKGRTVETTTKDAAFQKQYDADMAAGCYVDSLALQPDVDNTMQSRIVTINRYISNQMVKFIKGDRPLSEFNTFINELNKMGVNEVVAACNKGINK